MLYLVFSRHRSTPHEMYYIGGNKQDAIDKFQWAASLVFDATANTGDIYFVCFDTSTNPGALFKDKVTAADYTQNDINIIMNNLSRAAGSFRLGTLVPFGAKVNPAAILCSKCANTSGSNASTAVYKSAYGDFYCEKCWNNYIRPVAVQETEGEHTATDGLVEYAIGIACGAISVDTFTDTEKEFIAAVWQKKKSEITHLPNGYTINTIELRCAAKGFKLTK